MESHDIISSARPAVIAEQYGRETLKLIDLAR
jgi:hypothetical protein